MNSKLPLIAALVAFLMAVVVALNFWAAAPILLPLALVPLAAGVGMFRGIRWSAYGLALYLLCQLLLLPFLMVRSGSAAENIPLWLISAAFGGFLVILFYSAGRAMPATTSRKGSPAPWIAVSALTTLPLLFYQAFVLPTGSMENTIMTNEKILVKRSPGAINRGDLVVHTYPIDRRQTFVKRVIGVPGDRLRIMQKHLYLNGVLQNEPYVVYKTDYMDSYRDNFPSEPNAPIFPAAQEMLLKNARDGELIVPTGKLFVMGDNRDQSLDSRYWGFLAYSDVIGKPVLIYGSPQKSRLFKRL